MGTKPLLTIGMIFKNEIRCLERCLKALQPLRDAISCELVMADTGSTDGSRAVAEKYADILFDFPWIDDFAAARNAVMDRASGEWYLTVDADEYLDPDVSELTEFLRRKGQPHGAGTVIQRNYVHREMDGQYSDFSALRLLKMSTGLRYHGAIHESWSPKDGENIKIVVMPLTKTILHHDGYVDLTGESGRAKRERNLKLLRRELEKTPDDLRRLQQYLESGMKEPDFVDKIRYAAGLIEGKRPGWENYGPAIFRLAVAAASDQKLPEIEAWIQRAVDWFPDSYFTRIDVASLAFGYSWNEKKDYGACIRWGEMYFDACAQYDGDLEKRFAFLSGAVSKASPADRENMRAFLAGAYVKEARPEKALPLLMEMDVTQMNTQVVGTLTDHILSVHWHTPASVDTAPLIWRLWEQIDAPGPDPEMAAKRKIVFFRSGDRVFSTQYRDAESFKKEALRPAYTLFLPLKDKCTLGIAAAVLKSRDPQEAADLLGQVERWNEFPASALVHALELGVSFPLRPMRLEELDELAERMAQEPGDFASALERAAGDRDLQSLAWARALVLAGVQTCKWEDAEEDLALARRFASVEKAFLPRCYAPEVLTEEGIDLLPPMHRLGWYCARAFDALDGGDAAGHVRLLRLGLTSCESAKPMVEFLLEHTPQLQAPRPSPELLALAEQVRTMLAAYDPEDPAVAALKASDAYQEVAYLIEG